MTRELNRFIKIHKENYKTIKEEIQNNKQEIKNIEYIFPLIHGCNKTLNKNYNFSNIIEAREYINNKDLKNNIIELGKILLKKQTNNIEDIIGKKDSEIFKASLTLFEYITNPNINNLLLFRNYDKKLIQKEFKEDKEFSIFKKLLKKYFNNETDKETILLIESEIFEYSKKDITLKNINKDNLKVSENLLIKYSEICPIVIYSLEKNSNKEKEFFKNLTDKEYILFCEFNINKKIIKMAKKYKRKINYKLTALVPLCVLLLCGNVLLTSKTTVSYGNDLISIVSKEKLSKIEEKVKSQIIEENIPEESKEIPKEEIKPIQRTYSYITPTGVGNVDLVNIASSQVGNIGGEPYWSWYGFTYRVEWCACFVSWVSNQAGINTNIIPKFSRVIEGANWFINNNLFRDRNYTPRSGDLIFFDYDYNGISDHVGIVEKAENGRVYTIEGNSLKDDCSKHVYTIGDNTIFGYGTPNY